MYKSSIIDIDIKALSLTKSSIIDIVYHCIKALSLTLICIKALSLTLILNDTAKFGLLLTHQVSW